MLSGYGRRQQTWWRLFHHCLLSCYIMTVLSVTSLPDNPPCELSGCECHPMGQELQAHCASQHRQACPQFGDVARNITNLDLSYNNLQIVSVSSFPALPNLIRLDLRHSHVSSIEEGAFTGLPRLIHLELDYNELRAVTRRSFHALPGLRSLSLERNLLQRVEKHSFSGMSLEQLSLQKNERLELLSMGSFFNSSVQLLSIGGCSLASESLQALRDLKDTLMILFVSHSTKPLNIPASLFNGFKLEMLHLTNNSLHSLDFMSGNLTVHQLDISYNSLISVNMNIFTTVTVLNMNHCGLKCISCTSPCHLPHLEELDLSWNQLTHLNASTFIDLTHLRRLNLKSNLLQTLSSEMVSVYSKLTYLGLRENPLSCDCRLDWLRVWLRDNTTTTLTDVITCKDSKWFLAKEAQPMVCTSPHNIRLQQVRTSESTISSYTAVCLAEGIPLPLININMSVNGASIVSSSCSSDSRRDTIVSSPVQASACMPVSDSLTTPSCQKVTCTACNMLGCWTANQTFCKPQMLFYGDLGKKSSIHLPTMTARIVLCVFCVTLATLLLVTVIHGATGCGDHLMRWIRQVSPRLNMLRSRDSRVYLVEQEELGDGSGHQEALVNHSHPGDQRDSTEDNPHNSLIYSNQTMESDDV